MVDEVDEAIEESIRDCGLDNSQFLVKIVAAAAGTLQLVIIVEGLAGFHKGPS